MDRTIDSIPSETIKALESWSWPGNVRELENFIERSVILSRGSSLRAPLSELRADTPEADGDSTLDHMERNHILNVFRESRRRDQRGRRPSRHTTDDLAFADEEVGYFTQQRLTMRGRNADRTGCIPGLKS